MSNRVCITAGATTPFDYRPTGYESTEEGAVISIRKIREDMIDFLMQDIDFVVYSYVSVHFGHQKAPEYIYESIKEGSENYFQKTRQNISMT